MYLTLQKILLLTRMNIFVDKRIPSEALSRLSDFGHPVLFSSHEITYESVSCHPDIFVCGDETLMIIAPNILAPFFELISNSGKSVRIGNTPVGNSYPESAVYNAVITEKYLIHNFHHTDPVITDHAGERTLIHVSQGYTRCNLLPLKNDHFIASDAGIFRTLQRYGLHVLYVNPSEIILPGMKHGFFGGACGIFEDRAFISGSLKKFNDGEKVREYLRLSGYQIIELYDGPLFDAGSILFI